MALSEYLAVMGTIKLGSTDLAIIWSTGVPDGDSAPQEDAVKGSLYIQTDAGTDESPLWLKVDTASSDDDWVQVFVANESASATDGRDWNAAMTFLTDKKLHFRDANTYIYSNSGSILHLVAASSVRVGDGTNESIFAEDGHMTMAGTARPYSEVWVPAADFGMSGSDFEGDPLYDAGSMVAGSLGFDVSGSIFVGEVAGSAIMRALKPAANVTGSMTHANATVPVPLSADTTGSVSARVVWTATNDHATSGSVFVFKAGMTYVSSSATIRAAASTGASPAYNYTASGTLHETDLGNLPSFGSGDVAAFLTVGHDQSETDDTGGSAVAILGVKLRHLMSQLGEAS